jgi:ABC-2 type transport system permease protein
VKIYIVVPLVAVLLVLRVALFRRRRQRRAQDQAGQSPDAVQSGQAQGSGPPAGRRLRGGRGVFGDVGIIAGREIRERVKGRLFRVGTLIILAAVAAAIVIPKVTHSSSGPTVQKVAVVGNLAPDIRQIVAKTGSRVGDSVRFTSEPSLAAAKADLRSGKTYVAIVDGNEVLLNEPATQSSSPADPTFVQEVADLLGVLNAYRSAGLTTAQATEVSGARPVPVHMLKAGSSKSTANGTSVFGVILLFVMLSQYDTWILIGVMQEKSSRVVEVLLATVRPIQLLGGKVLGIGLVALGQATVIVAFALILAAAVGSDLLHGSAPLVLVCQLLWLVLGYAFYCWVYAAGGSTAERQDQVQTLAFPLSIPILVGYIFSLTVAGSGNADLLYKILAYLPPTAPFCMPVLVSLHLVTWWEFLGSVLISIAATVGMAVFAARIYGRAVLRTGGRVRIRDLFQHAAR